MILRIAFSRLASPCKARARVPGPSPTPYRLATRRRPRMAVEQMLEHHDIAGIRRLRRILHALQQAFKWLPHCGLCLAVLDW